MTPAGCGDCCVRSPSSTSAPGSRGWRRGPRSCLPPSAGTAPAGTSASTCTHPTCTPTVAICPDLPAMITGLLGWTEVLFATVSRHGSRWYVSLNVHAPDLHANRRHLPRPAGDDHGFVGLDRG